MHGALRKLWIVRAECTHGIKYQSRYMAVSKAQEEELKLIVTLSAAGAFKDRREDDRVKFIMRRLVKVPDPSNVHVRVPNNTTTLKFEGKFYMAMSAPLGLHAGADPWYITTKMRVPLVKLSIGYDGSVIVTPEQGLTVAEWAIIESTVEHITAKLVRHEATMNSKRVAFAKLCSVFQKGGHGTPEMRQAVKNFVRAPGLMRMDRMECGTYQDPYGLLDIAVLWADPELQRWLFGTPKKRTVRDPTTGVISKWTTSRYKNIQRIERGVSKQIDVRNVASPSAKVAGQSAGVLRNVHALQTYMTRYALRAPTRPQRAPDGPLYRGVMLTEPQLKALVRRGQHTDRGFMAFTRDGAHAANFGSRTTQWGGRHFVMFRLRLGDVARGTPWIWYASEEEERQVRGQECNQLATNKRCVEALRRLHFLGWEAASHGGGEQETLLPPGTLTIKKVTRIDNGMRQKMSLNEKQLVPLPTRANTVSWIDVTYTPDARYAMKPRRKGTREHDSNILWDVFAPIKRNRTNIPAQAAKQRAKRSRQKR